MKAIIVIMLCLIALPVMGDDGDVYLGLSVGGLNDSNAYTVSFDEYEGGILVEMEDGTLMSMTTYTDITNNCNVENLEKRVRQAKGLLHKFLMEKLKRFDYEDTEEIIETIRLLDYEMSQCYCSDCMN